MDAEGLDLVSIMLRTPLGRQTDQVWVRVDGLRLVIEEGLIENVVRLVALQFGPLLGLHQFIRDLQLFGRTAR